MEKAAECAVYYSAVRPDGRHFSTLLTDNEYTSEKTVINIAMDYDDTEAVMDYWAETSTSYEYMTSEDHEAVGLGCFYQGDTKYWVQIFHEDVLGTEDIPDKAVYKEGIKVNAEYYYAPMSIKQMDGCDGINIYEGITIKPAVYVFNIESEVALDITGEYDFVSQNSGIASASGDTLTGVSAGECNVELMLNDSFGFVLPVNVLERPVISTVANSNGKLTVELEGTLDSESGATLYFKEADDDMWSVSNVTNASPTYTLHGVYPGEKYTFVVRYYDEAYGWTEVSDRHTVTVPLEKPVVKGSNVASSGKVKLTWDSVSGASEYKVYRATSKSGTYKLMKTTEGTSYTNTSATAGKTYYYKVKAVAASGVSRTSSIVTRTCDLPRPVLSVTNVSSSGKIKVTWDAVDGADRYKVYRKIGSDGEYKLMKTTEGTSYTNTSAKAGTKYYYKAIAVDDSKSAANSAYSSVKSRVCDLPRPVVSIKLNSNGHPRLTWEAIDGACEYKVYRATSKSGTYKLMKTTEGTSYTNTSATAGKTYYYKVKAIHKSNSSANSAYSLVDYITAK